MDESIKKTFNLYCDESCHIENDKKPFMLHSYINSAFPNVKIHKRNINEIKKRHNFFAEIKWTNVSNSKYEFYRELLHYFVNSDLKFRAVIVEKSKINTSAFNSNYHDFYYKMYYYLLIHDISANYIYNVYLDKKDSLGPIKVKTLKNILNTKFGVFNNVQTVLSDEVLLLQVCDFIMGAISYYKNQAIKQNQAKVKLIEELIQLTGVSLDKTNSSSKLNLFYINLK